MLHSRLTKQSCSGIVSRSTNNPVSLRQVKSHRNSWNNSRKFLSDRLLNRLDNIWQAVSFDPSSMGDESKNPFRRVGLDLATAAIGSFLFEALKWGLLAAAGWAVSGLSITWLATTFAAFAPYKIYLVTLLFTVVVSTVTWFYRRRDPFRPKFPCIECDFYIIEKCISYKYISGGDIRYTRKYRLRALRNGLDRFADTYRWTGNGRMDVKSDNPDHVINQPDTKGVFQIYEVTFERTLNKGETIDFSVIWALDDSRNTSKPFIATTIHAPTDKLILTVELPAALGVTEVIKEHSPDIGAVRPFESTPEPIVNNRCEWVIKKPKLLHNYSLKWNPKNINGH